MAASRPTRKSAPSPTMIIAALTAVLLALGIGMLLGPQRQQVGEQSTGDAVLAERVRDVVGDTGGFRSLAVAEVTADSITWAGLGNSGPGRAGSAPDEATAFELGSITKTFTTGLFADAIERGEVAADDRLADHVIELGDTPAGQVSLGSLAQHRSGLPPLGATAMTAGLSATVLNENPYASSSLDRVIADARTAQVNPDQPPTYSNFGISLLGEALVRASGADDYPSLVTERITRPLGMDSTGFVPTQEAIPANATPGFIFNGTPAARWTGEGYLPAGTSTFTTIADQARWAQAQLTGEAAGVAALDPTADYSGAKIGWAWLTTTVTGSDGGEHTVVLHNGMTAGFSSMMVLDRESGRGVVVLGNTNTAVDSIALALLHGIDVQGQPTAVVIGGWIVYGIAVLLSSVALWRCWRSRSALPAIGALVGAAFGLVLLWHSGPWISVGGWAYGVALAPALAGLAALAVRARTLPFQPERRVWLTWSGVGVGVLLIVGLTQLW